MTVRIDGTNSTANPAITGADTDTGLQFGTNEVKVVTDGTARATVDSSGRLLVGTSTARGNFYGTTGQEWRFQIEGVGYLNAGQAIINNSNDALGSYLGFAKSRGTSVGSNTVVQSGDDLGVIDFHGNDGTDFTHAARIVAEVDGTPGDNDMPGRLVFLTTAATNSSPTTRMSLLSDGNVVIPAVYSSTTASAANVNVNSSGYLIRSISSVKYKTDVETLEDSYADAILNCRPVWYRSLCDQDKSSWGWWGFIAEEVAKIDPRLVHWKTVEVTYDDNGSAVSTPCDPEPEGVAYDRFVPHLLNLIKRQQQAIETLEAKVTALEVE